MKKKLQKISMAVAAIVLFVGVMLLSVEKNDQGQWEVATVSSFAQGGESNPGNWAAEYPACEYTVSIGIPPIVVNKTKRGTYRDCVAGTGVCLYSDNICCGLRVKGVCADII